MVLKPVSSSVPKDMKAWERIRQCVGEHVEVTQVCGPVKEGILDSVRFDSEMQVVVIEGEDEWSIINFANVVRITIQKGER
jgi:RNase P/RNase MRP subunit p29